MEPTTDDRSSNDSLYSQRSYDGGGKTSKVAAKLAASDVRVHSSGVSSLRSSDLVIMDESYLGVDTATLTAQGIQFRVDVFHMLVYPLEALVHQGSATRIT